MIFVLRVLKDTVLLSLCQSCILVQCQVSEDITSQVISQGIFSIQLCVRLFFR